MADRRYGFPRWWLGVSLTILGSCFHPDEPYQLHVWSGPDGGASFAISGCRGDRYDGEIFHVDTAVTTLESYLNGRFVLTPVVPSTPGASRAALPQSTVEVLTVAAAGSGGSRVLVVRFGLRRERGDSEHFVTLYATEAASALASADPEDESDRCLWTT